MSDSGQNRVHNRIDTISQDTAAVPALARRVLIYVDRKAAGRSRSVLRPAAFIILKESIKESNFRGK